MEQIDWRFAHPGADMRAAANPATLLSSSVGSMLIDQITATDSDAAARLDAVKRASRTVRRIAVSIQRKEGQTQDLLVYLKGDFDDAAKKELIEGSTFRLTPSTVARLVKADVILVGEPASVAQAQKRMAEPVTALPAADSWSANDVWAEGPVEMLGERIAKEVAPVLLVLNRFRLGVSFGLTPVFNVALDTKSPEAADGILNIVRAAYGRITAPLAARPQLAYFVMQALTFKKAGEKLDFRFSAPSFFVEAGLAKTARVSTEAAAVLQPLLWDVLGNPASEQKLRTSSAHR